MPQRTILHPPRPVTVNPRRLHKTILQIPVRQIHPVGNHLFRSPRPGAVTAHLPAAMPAAVRPAAVRPVVVRPVVVRPVVVRPVVVRPVVARPTVVRLTAPGMPTPRPVRVVLPDRSIRLRHRLRSAVATRQAMMRRMPGRVVKPRLVHPMMPTDRTAVHLTAVPRVMAAARHRVVPAVRVAARPTESCRQGQPATFWTRSRAR